jgi:hypothetical protein
MLVFLVLLFFDPTAADLLSLVQPLVASVEYSWYPSEGLRGSSVYPFFPVFGMAAMKRCLSCSTHAAEGRKNSKDNQKAFGKR